MKKYWVHIGLFAATLSTTTFAGAILSGEFREGERIFNWLVNGLRFSLPLLAILGVHEIGHYIASRVHNISATLPFFIPAPTLIGTFGAVIRIKEPIGNRNALMDVGASGPIAGFLVALPVIIWGLTQSKIIFVPQEIVGLRLGDSILMKILVWLIVGDIPENYELVLSPTAFAGWLGLFVTALNLIPTGQLDGGHILYALLGEKARPVFRVIFLLLLPLGYFWTGWLFWALMVLFILRVQHPPIAGIEQPLDHKRRIAGIICFLIFILTFTPVPFS